MNAFFERRYIRAYKQRPPRFEEKIRYVIHVKRNKQAIKNERIGLGWRLYATIQINLRF